MLVVPYGKNRHAVYLVGRGISCSNLGFSPGISLSSNNLFDEEQSPIFCSPL